MADGAASTGNVAAQASAGESAPQDFLVQYVVVRKDLWTSSGWPLGSVVAQVGAKASWAVETRDHGTTSRPPGRCAHDCGDLVDATFHVTWIYERLPIVKRSGIASVGRLMH